MKFILIWIAATMTVEGPVAMQTIEKRQFADKTACERYAATYKARMADYYRGVLRLDWDDQVMVTHRCRPPGQGV